MQFYISKSALEVAANNLARVINPKSPLPILSNILCVVSGDKLYMRASDAEVSIETTLPLAGAADADGTFCIPATRLCAALSALSEQVITVTADPDGDKTCHIIYDSGETFFEVEPAEQFPTPPEMNADGTFTINGARLREALRCTQWAAATDELRSQLCGCYMTDTDRGLDVVATDGRSLVRYTLTDIHDKCTANIPRKAVRLIAQMLDDGDATLTYCTTRGIMRASGYTLSFVMLEGTYPNYNAVIPRNTKQTAHAGRDALIGSIRRVSPFGNSASGLLTLTFEGDTLTMKGDDMAYGCGAKDHTALSFEGEATTIGVNGPLMLSLLTYMETDEVVVKMTDPAHPLVVIPATPQPDTDVLMMCMPMRVDV